MYSEMETKIDLMGSFATEVTNYAMNNQLYFNPGIAEWCLAMIIRTNNKYQSATFIIIYNK